MPGDPDAQVIAEAVEHLGLADWISSLDEGLHTGLGRGTGRLSAGGLQLIGPVRAALLDRRSSSSTRPPPTSAPRRRAPWEP
ncbi:hypothetical protein [Streptomyces sp. NPDC045714]|uniref:hypothetical protein n=1 Tax=Streptomyces sp. NPDC045714 TaxID=3154913 RepID=UPI0033F0E762